MTLLHIMSVMNVLCYECVKSELDLLTVTFTQMSIEKSYYVEIPPLSAITDASPIEFL